MEEIENEYEVFRNGMNHYELRVGDQQSICPFAGAFPMYGQVHPTLATPNQQPQTILTGFARLPCNTGCPLAELHKEPNGDLKYTVHCGGNIRTLNVTELLPEQTDEGAEDSARILSMDK